MSQYNILVVDDDREIVRSLGKLLELEGYRVKKAYNGMEALDILMTEQIHLILLDVMMPKNERPFRPDENKRKKQHPDYHAFRENRRERQSHRTFDGRR